MSKLKNKNDEEEADDDEEDEDYVPEGANESLSNEEENLDEENKVIAKKRKSKNSPEDDSPDSESGVEDQGGLSKKKDSQDVTLEFDKKKADDLWSSFLKDVKPASLATNSHIGSNKYKLAENKASEGSNDSTREQSDSAININKNGSSDVKSFFNQSKVEKVNTTPNFTKKEETIVKKPKLSGLAGILDKIKEPKINTLEKSRLDWEEFKKNEKIEDDLNTLSKGKGSYLDRQAFLERADMRQFEIEKELRNKERKSRELNK